MQKNAPASDGGVKIEQAPTETINEAQRVEFEGEARHKLTNEGGQVLEIQENEELAERIKNSDRNKYDVIRDYLFEKLGGQEFVLSDGRKAIMDKRDAQKLSQKADAKRTVQLGNLRQIIETAKYSHSTGKAEHKKFTQFHYYGVSVKYNGEQFDLWLNVGVGKNDSKNHIYAITNKKEGAPTNYGVSRPGGNAIQNASSINSIPQNGEKSTPLGEKVTESASDNGSKREALPKTRDAKERKRKRAQEHQRQSREKRKAERMAQAMREEVVRNAEQNAEANAEQGTAAQETVEKAKIPARGYTDAEANDARALVKDFDLMPADTRRAIVELMRSGKASGASKNFLRHSANLIAYWRRGLWIIADGKARDDGFYYVLDDGTRLITVNPKKEAKAVSETLMHELAHDVWARADAKIRKTLYDLATAGVDQKEIEEIREQYRTELTNRGELTNHDADGNTVDMTEAEINALLDEEVATNLLGETISTEEFLSRFDGEGKFPAAKRIWRTLYNMKKRFTGKDKFLYRKADDLFKQFTKVMAVEEVGVQASDGKARYSLSENAATELHKALYNRNYNDEIRLRDESPGILIRQKGVRNLPMAMQVSHARENIFTEAEAKKLGLRVDNHTHYHGLGEKFFLQIIDGLDDVTEAYRGTKTAEKAERRENYFLLVSTFKDQDGNEINVPVYINDFAHYNQAMIDVNKISTVFGREKFRAYITREIQKGNLVRIKKRSNPIGDPNALIAKRYDKDASTTIITENPEKSTGFAKKLLEERISGDDLLNAQDLISDVKELGGQVDDYGYITLYHRTSSNNAAAIHATGEMLAKEDGLFFSTKRDGQNVGYGDTIVTFSIPAEKLLLDDIFDDEAHLRYPLKKLGRVSMKEYLVNDKADNGTKRNALPKKPKSQTTEKKARLTKEEKADEYKKVMDTIDENEDGYHTRLDYQKISEALDRRAKEKAKAKANVKAQTNPADEITRENFEKAVAAERERLEREAAARILNAEKGAKKPPASRGLRRSFNPKREWRKAENRREWNGELAFRARSLPR